MSHIIDKYTACVCIKMSITILDLLFLFFVRQLLLLCDCQLAGVRDFEGSDSKESTANEL